MTAKDPLSRAGSTQADVISVLANAMQLYRAGQTVEGMAEARCAIDLDPKNPQGFYILALCLDATDRLEEAAEAYRSALRRDAKFFKAQNNLALTLARLGKADQAIEHFAQLVNAYPSVAQFHSNLGLAYKEVFQMEPASVHFRKALELDPHNPDTHFKLAVTRLAIGDFQEGLREFEWRWKYYETVENTTVRTVPGTRWKGEPLRGRNILLHAEQGFGDSIQFIRFAQQVTDGGGNVLFDCPPELLRLFTSAKGIREIGVPGMPHPRFALQCPVMSLPLVLGTTLATIPNKVPYLYADPKLLAQKAPLVNGSGLKVGLVWMGQPKHKNDIYRSIPIETLAPWAQIPGISWYSLQIGATAQQLGFFGDRMVDLGTGLGDFADTAAIMASLDLVISVDTAAAHLAGALGREVWIMLASDPDWRWLLHREDSPWYPTARLFRQTQRNQWPPVIARVEAELRRRAQEPKRG